MYFDKFVLLYCIYIHVDLNIYDVMLICVVNIVNVVFY